MRLNLIKGPPRIAIGRDGFVVTLTECKGVTAIIFVMFVCLFCMLASSGLKRINCSDHIPSTRRSL